MAELSVRDHLKYLNELRAEQMLWRPLWKNITDYALPRRSFWDVDGAQGKVPATKVYDGTAIADLQLLVDGMCGNLMSIAFPWISLEMEDQKLQRLAGVADYLEELETIFLGEYARSNFYEASNELMMDLAGIGTGCMFMGDDVERRRILFSTRHMKECFIAENYEGRVDTLYRDYTMANRQAVQQWGNKLTKQRRDKAKDNPFGKAHVVHAVYPRTDRPGAAKMFASVYIDKDIPEIIDEGGYDMFPYLIPRWRKNTDETYGRAPAGDGMPDILRINQMARTLLEAGQFAVQPPLNVPMAQKGLERIVPRGYNYYTKPDEQITPINLAQNYPIGEDQERQVREAIHDIFRTKLFLLIEQLEKGPYTATEIRERVAEKAAVMGPVISRLNSELLIPLVERTFLICQKNGLLPDPPASLTRGGRVRIRFKGPLAQAQEKYHQTQGVLAGLAFLKETLTMYPDSSDNVVWDELNRIGMDAMGMPQKAIRESPEVDKMRKIRAKAMEMQRQEAIAMEREKLAASNAEKLNQPLRPGSMLEAASRAEAQKQAQEAGAQR